MLACRIILWVYKDVYKNNTKIIYGIILYLNIYGAHTLQLQEEPFHFLIRFLNTFKFSADFIWYGKLLQIFGPKLSKLLVQKVTCFFLEIFKFSLYCSLAGLELSLGSRVSVIKLGFKLFKILYLNAQFMFSFNIHGKFTRFFQYSFVGTRVIVKHEPKCSFM